VRTRLLTAFVLILLAICLVLLGGIPFLIAALILLTAAEIEFCRIMAHRGFLPFTGFAVALVWVLALDASWPQAGLVEPGVVVIMLASLVWQLCHRQGVPVADWALTVTGGLYVGLCGGSMIRLRGLSPDGLWWTTLAVSANILADCIAFLIGRKWGRHQMAPKLSPGKTWEGYLAGVIVGGVGTAMIGAGVRAWVAPGAAVSGWHGLALGIVIPALVPLGDLAVSMIKREAGVKDTGTLMPGHGGVLDRLDSMLWAGVLGYYYVQCFAT